MSAKKVSMAAEKFVSTLTSASLKMSITVQKTRSALIHRAVSLAHATMATMKRTKSVSRMSTNVI